MSQSLLEVADLTAWAGDSEILHEINLKLQRNKIYALMGPNGSGKSTLARVIMGHPDYRVNPDATIKFDGQSLLELSTDKRSQTGIAMTFQTPPEIAGVRLGQLLQVAIGKRQDALTTHRQIKQYAQELKLNPELLERSLNESASGGERKKLEVLQAAILDRPLTIFDEIDTGVDVDALKIIGNFLTKHRADKTYLVITHYERILQYLQPDEVIIMHSGKIVQVGSADLVRRIQTSGFHDYDSL